MTPTAEQRDLIEGIILKQASILGRPVAIRRARNVAGFEIDDEGFVKAVPENINQALADLVAQYKMLSGAVGVDNCKKAAAAWLNNHPSAVLPPVLL